MKKAERKIPKPRPTKKGARHWVDEYVGAKLRAARKAAKLSQEKLGKQIGVSFQQMQKYENGTNRLSVSALYEISRHLHIPYEDLMPRQPDDEEQQIAA